MGRNDPILNVQLHCSILCGIGKETSPLHGMAQIGCIKGHCRIEIFWNQTICVRIGPFQQSCVKTYVLASKEQLIIGEEDFDCLDVI